MSDQASQWCTIESDPGVFTSLIESFGVQNAELSELWSLDDDSLCQVLQGGRVYGLIFLFKWLSSHHAPSSEGKEDSSRKALTSDDTPPNLFFAKQVTTNACATQAILSVLLNVDEKSLVSSEKEGDKKDENVAVDCQTDKIVLGSTLSTLKSFSMPLPPDLRGETIGASEEIRSAHNSFARTDAFLAEESRNKMLRDEEKEDVFHFVAYVPHDECVYELDGLRPGPIRIGKVEDDKGDDAKKSGHSDMAWLAVARKAVQDRIEKFAAGEIKFNLMAVVQDRRCGIRAQLASLDAAGTPQDDDQRLEAHAALATEEGKRERWKIENDRRRHNYLPFCVELIRALAGSGKLPELTKKASERVVKRRKQAKAFMEGKKEE